MSMKLRLCSSCCPPALHTPVWRQPEADTTTSDVCGPHRGRAVTPTTRWRGSAGAEQRPGMAVAAYTGSLPVHPRTPSACPGVCLAWHWVTAGSPATFRARTTRTCCPPGPWTPAGRAPAHDAGRELRRLGGTPLLLSTGLLLSMTHAQAAAPFLPAQQTLLAVKPAEYCEKGTGKARLPSCFQRSASGPAQTDRAQQQK
jgi:hypothetical protein